MLVTACMGLGVETWQDQTTDSIHLMCEVFVIACRGALARAQNDFSPVRQNTDSPQPHVSAPRVNRARLGKDGVNHVFSDVCDEATRGSRLVRVAGMY